MNIPVLMLEEKEFFRAEPEEIYRQIKENINVSETSKEKSTHHSHYWMIEVVWKSFVLCIPCMVLAAISGVLCRWTDSELLYDLYRIISGLSGIFFLVAMGFSYNSVKGKNSMVPVLLTITAPQIIYMEKSEELRGIDLQYFGIRNLPLLIILGCLLLLMYDVLNRYIVKKDNGESAVYNRQTMVICLIMLIFIGIRMLLN